MSTVNPFLGLDPSFSGSDYFHRAGSSQVPSTEYTAGSGGLTPAPVPVPVSADAAGGTSLVHIRRGLVRARQMLFASEIRGAFALMEEIDLALRDQPSTVAQRFAVVRELLRAVGCAYRDDGAAMRSIASSCLKQQLTRPEWEVALTLCCFGYWRSRELTNLYATPRCHTYVNVNSTKWYQIIKMVDLSVEAAVEFDRLRLVTAKRLALDALGVSPSGTLNVHGANAMAASVAAQAIYEEGRLEEAEALLRQWLPAIDSVGTADSAIRAYVVLIQIARYRMQHDIAASVAYEAKTLGVRRGWPRLVALGLAERAFALVQDGSLDQARECMDELDRYAEDVRFESEYSRMEVVRCSKITRGRVSLANQPTIGAVAELRILYYEAIGRKEQYVGCRLAVELADALAAIGELAEADGLFFKTLETGAAVGLYQVFLDGKDGLGILLMRAYRYANRAESPRRDLLSFIAGLLERWQARQKLRNMKKPPSRVNLMLTAREREILNLMGHSFSNKRIALALDISPETVKSHIKRIFFKLTVNTRIEAVLRAGMLGLF